MSTRSGIVCRASWRAAVAVVLCAALWARAQQAEPGSADSAAPGGAAAGAAAPVTHATQVRATGLQLGYLFATSPLINGLILGLSVLAMLLFLYFLLTIKTGALAPPRFIDEVNKLLRNRDFKEAADYCRDHPHLFSASIVQRCVENSEKSHSVLMEMIDIEGRRRADLVWNRISYLADVSNVAPMLGLLGTVVGMIQAFFVYLPERQASITARDLSSAVGGAMSTTMFGLIVAILALMFHTIIRGRVTQALAETEQILHSIADQIKRGEP